MYLYETFSNHKRRSRKLNQENQSRNEPLRDQKTWIKDNLIEVCQGRTDKIPAEVLTSKIFHIWRYPVGVVKGGDILTTFISDFESVATITCNWGQRHVIRVRDKEEWRGRERETLELSPCFLLNWSSYLIWYRLQNTEIFLLLSLCLCQTSFL